MKNQNTGDTTAWIRATVVITWKDKNGNVYGQAPVVDTDYTIVWSWEDKANPETGWLKGNDGFYYWNTPVNACTCGYAEGKVMKCACTDNLTGVLIMSCEKIGTAPAGYDLSVEIIGSGLQSVPDAAFNDAWAESSGLEISGGVLVKGGTNG